jgi:hypothetical protein
MKDDIKSQLSQNDVAFVMSLYQTARCRFTSSTMPACVALPGQLPCSAPAAEKKTQIIWTAEGTAADNLGKSCATISYRQVGGCSMRKKYF